MPHPLRMHHIAIICSDHKKSKDFYHRILGLRILAENYRAERDSWKLDLAMGDGVQVELFSFPNPPERLTRPEAQGLRHLAFAVTHLDEWVEHLAKEGIVCEPIRVDEFTNKRFTFFQDPDHLPLEIYELN